MCTENFPAQPVLRLWDMQAYIDNRARDIVLVPKEITGTGMDARSVQPYTVISHTWAQDLRAYTRLLVAKGWSDCPEEQNTYPAVIRRGQGILHRAVSTSCGTANVRDATLGLAVDDYTSVARTLEMLDTISALVQRFSKSPRYAWVDFVSQPGQSGRHKCGHPAYGGVVSPCNRVPCVPFRI